MINCSIDKGIVCSGTVDELLTEYTVLTKIIFRQLINDYNEDKALKILSGIGQIAVNNYKDVTDISKTYDNLIEVLDNEL